MKPSRRQILIGMTIGGASLFLPRLPAGLFSRPEAVEVNGLAEEFRRASREGALPIAAGAMAAGADTTTLLAAVFMAGITEIRPRSVGQKLHALMMVSSTFELAQISSPEEARLAVLWNLDDVKRSQARDVREGDWHLPPRPVVSFASEEKARREFFDAMSAWDDQRADSALVGLLPFHNHVSFFEILWPMVMSSYVDLGHKVIFGVQVERVLRRIGWQYAEPVLRSLIYGLLYVEAGERKTESFERSLSRLPDLPAKPWQGKEDPSQSASILGQLRQASANKAQDLVMAALAAGIGPATLWDGLRLYAAELFHRRPRSALRRHGPVHPVTEVNAFAYIWRTSNNDQTKALALLQAAAWLPLLRDDLITFFGEPEGATIDTLGLSPDSPALDDVFQKPSPARAHRFLHEAENIAPFLTRMRHCLFHKATQDHQYKFTAALHEEAGLIHPSLCARFLAPAVTYLPNGTDPDTDVLHRSQEALARFKL